MRISRWLHAKHCKLRAHPTDNLGAHLDRNMPQAKNCGSTVVSAVSRAGSLAAKTRKRCRNQRQRLPRILLKAKPSLLIHAVRRTTRPLGETDEAMVWRSKEVHSRKRTWQWKITILSKIGVTSSNGPYFIAIFVFGRIYNFLPDVFRHFFLWFLPALVRSNPLTPWLGTRACGKTQQTSELNQLNGYIIVGLGWWFGILRVPLSNNPFHRGIPGIQTTNPNQQLNIGWLKIQLNKKSSGATPKTHFLTFHSLSTSIAFTFTYKFYYHFASSPHSYSVCTDFGEFAPARPKSWEPREIPRQQRLGSGRPYHWWQQASDIPIAGSRHRVQCLGRKRSEGNLSWKKINDTNNGIYKHTYYNTIYIYVYVYIIIYTYNILYIFSTSIICYAFLDIIFLYCVYLYMIGGRVTKQASAGIRRPNRTPRHFWANKTHLDSMMSRGGSQPQRFFGSRNVAKKSSALRRSSLILESPP